jgi:hypothetical protein
MVSVGACPYCKRKVRHDSEARTLEHEVPVCGEFEARIAKDFPRAHAEWVAEQAGGK